PWAADHFARRWDIPARPRGHRASIARAPHSVDRGIPREHGGWRADQLRLRPHGAVLRHRELCPAACRRCQAVRHADRAVAALLHGGQSQDGGIARWFFVGCVHRSGQRGTRVSNCHLVAARSLIDLATSRLALRAPALRAATALTRPNRSAQRLPCGRYTVPTAMTIGPNNIVTNHCVERGDHLTHHRSPDTIVPFGFFPAASGRSWNALSPGFQLLALIAAM